MDSIIVGRFIAALRKEKEWTQSQLAEKIGVTDKAVSRWETGSGLPDVSLLKPLADTLEVSVNELLSGQRLEAADKPRAADEIIIQTIRQAEHRVNRAINLSLLTVGVMLLLWGLLFLGYDTSWVSAYCWLGVILIAVAVFIMARKKLLRAVLLAAAVLTVSFLLFEARDYNAVTNLSLPPLFHRGMIETTFISGEKVIKYHKLFYTVYRYNVDKPDEFYEIKRLSP